MKFGVALSNLGAMATPENMFAVADKAEALGYHSVWVGDHLVLPLQVHSKYPYNPTGAFSLKSGTMMLDAFALLAALAGRTKRLGLGTSVLILPYRHPVLTAKLASTIDVLSGGRLLLGVGAGWMDEEFRALGAPPYKERGAVTDEQLAVLKSLWTEATPSFKGKFYQFDKIEVYPKPVQKPHIPLLIGGNTRAAMRRAAYNDGWHPMDLSPDALAQGIKELKAICKEVGRPYDTLRLTQRQPTLLQTNGNTAPLMGNAKHIVENFKRYQALGMEHMLMSIRAPNTGETMQQMERIADQVLPQVR